MNQGGFSDDVREIRVPKPPARLISIVALLLAAGAFVLTAVYTVGPEEVGVVLRFGHFQRTSDPGLHFKMPLGVERVSKVPVQRQLKEEFGYRTVRAGVRSQYSTQGLMGESNMLTGDLNAADVEWVVQYRIVDSYRYLFRVRNVPDTFRDISEAMMREVVGDRTVNEVLTVGRREVADLVMIKLQELCDQYELGVKIEQVVLQDVNVPDQVKPAFNEVNQAEQERERMINEAQSDYNKVIPRARGEAEQTIRQAEGYALDRVNRATGDAERFTAMFEAYRTAPEITRTRMYLETLGDVLPRVQEKTVIDASMTGILPFLNVTKKGGGE